MQTLNDFMYVRSVAYSLSMLYEFNGLHSFLRTREMFPIGAKLGRTTNSLPILACQFWEKMGKHEREKGNNGRSNVE